MEIAQQDECTLLSLSRQSVSANVRPKTGLPWQTCLGQFFLFLRTTAGMLEYCQQKKMIFMAFPLRNALVERARGSSANRSEHTPMKRLVTFLSNRYMAARAAIPPVLALSIFIAANTVQTALANPDPAAAEQITQEPPPPPRHGIVTADVLNVRARPGTSYEVVCKLHQGDEVVVVEEQGDWLGILAPVQADAWCAVRFLNDQGRAVADKVLVRSGPGVTFSDYAQLAEGRLVERIGRPRNGWQRIRPPAGAVVWVGRAFVELPPLPAAAVDAAAAGGAGTADRESMSEADAATAEAQPDAQNADPEKDGDAAPPESSMETAEKAATAPAEDEQLPPLEPVLAPHLANQQDMDEAPLNVGVLLPLKNGGNALATHALVRMQAGRMHPRCYLRSSLVDLGEWSGRQVRVYGKAVTYPNWRLPVIVVRGIQVENP